MEKNKWLFFFLVLISYSLSYEEEIVDYSHLPRWRGFNLLEKFSKEWSNKPFSEDDFKMISSFGFNFVRLPMDYRVWIKDNDVYKINEDVMKEIDQAVEYGRKYGVHVCINFHRAPGYSVNENPKEKTDLWTDPDTQKACAYHWAYFAKRYKGIPNKDLSFNLFNEPKDMDEEVYYRVVKIMVDAIREEDPNRLIIVDGLSWGTKPVEKLIPLKIAQATRGYFPANLTHYKASWVKGADRYPLPVWPMPKVNSFLFGPMKKEYKSPLIIESHFKEPTKLRIRVDTVSGLSRLVIKADGKQVMDKIFKCGPGDGEWEKEVYNKKWDIYQNIYNKDYICDIPVGTKQIEIENIEGDWLRFSEIEINGFRLTPQSQWGVKQGKVVFDPLDKSTPFKSEQMIDKEYMWRENILPWKKLESMGVGVIVGEWGAFNKTPHDVVLRWMEDCLTNWKQAGWGWALWNFRGSFGIMDSEREDVIYENFNGHKLDRKMLDLLQKY